MTESAKGMKRRFSFVVFLVVWLFNLTSWLIAATDRSAPQYPDAVRGFPHPYMSDVEFYVVLPALLVVLNLILAVLASKVPKWLAIIIAALQMYGLLVLVFLGSGGI